MFNWFVTCPARGPHAPPSLPHAVTLHAGSQTSFVSMLVRQPGAHDNVCPEGGEGGGAGGGCGESEGGCGQEEGEGENGRGEGVESGPAA